MPKTPNGVQIMVRHKPDMQRMAKALLLILLRPRQVSDMESGEDTSRRKEVSDENEVQ